MATFNRFEDIQAWQKARILTKIIYQITGDTDKDFANVLNISLGSSSETKSHIYIALDLEYISQKVFDDIYQKLDEVGKMVFVLSSHLRKF